MSKKPTFDDVKDGADNQAQSATGSSMSDAPASSSTDVSREAGTAGAREAASSLRAGDDPQRVVGQATRASSKAASRAAIDHELSRAGLASEEVGVAQNLADPALAQRADSGSSSPVSSAQASQPNRSNPSFSSPASTSESAPTRYSRQSPSAEEFARYSNTLGATLVQGLTGANLTFRVEYEFSCVGDAGTTWRVHRYRHSEAVCELYEVELELWTELAQGDPQAMLGTSAELTLSRDASERKVQGLVWRYEESQGTQRARVIRVWMVPAAFALTQRVDARIFQELNALEIAREVIEGVLRDYQRELEFRVQRQVMTREYCVQYRESDFALVSRLFESEGLYFWFEPGEKGHEKMIVSDRSHAAARIDNARGGELAVSAIDSGVVSAEIVQDFVLREALQANETVAGEFDWIAPSQRRKESAAGPDASQRKRQIYAPKPSATVRSSLANGENDLVTQAALRQEEQSASTRHGQGRSNSIGMLPGRGVMIVDNAEPSMDGEYTLLRVEHRGRGIAPAEDAASKSAIQGGDSEYENTFDCLPKALPYRPPRRTPKPSHTGPMTATVVGPAGEEIFTDEHGRIKVQFHWDRLGHDDERSSCFMRVAQAWAGPGWGTLFLPRIGMECIVTFLYDDIDQPLITGTVYNGTNVAPYTLPADQTKSTIKTRSSPGGDGFNELRFEDAAGQEEIFVQAQKDLNATIKNNYSRNVGAQESINVGGNRSKSVSKNETVSITGSQSVTIRGSEQGDGPVKGAALNITGKYKLDASDEITVQAPNKITLTCGGSSIEMVPGKITLRAGGNAQVVLDANALMEAAAHGKVFLDANANVHASGGGDLLLDANACMRSSAGSQVLLDGNALVRANAGAFGEWTADAVVKGANATLHGDTAATASAPTATLQGKAGSVEASGSGVSASGPAVTIAAQGSTSISGSVVKIN